MSSKSKYDYKKEVDNQEKVTVEEVTAPVTINYVKLQSQLDARLLYTGQETGKSYEWLRAGSVVEVDEKDAPTLLSKRTKKQSCCSGSDLAVFVKVD